MTEGYLVRFGEQLVRNGYAVIPIVKGTKRPPSWMSHKNGDPWSAVTPSLDRVRAWTRDKRLVGAGIGVNLGKGLVAFDLDIRDEAATAEMLEWCEWNLPGSPPQRIGQWPKTLLLFRCETAMRKEMSAEYLDGETGEGGKPRRARLECLADGEQFVAYAVHPDTGKPYEWPGADLLETKAADLPLITQGQVREAIAAFEAMAARRGWAKAPRLGAAMTSVDDPDDWTARVDPGAATNLTIEELRKAVFTIPNDDLNGSEADYDTWLQVGMAVFHQTQGGQEGLDIWCEWSNLASKHVQAECERKWRSFDITDKDRRPLTARWLLKVARELRDEKVTAQIDDLRRALDAAVSEDTLRSVARQAKSIEMDRPEREMMATLLQRRMKAVMGASIPVGVVRDMIRYEKSVDRPKWLEHWCYIGTEGVFYNRVSQVSLKTEAFDAAFARNLLTDIERREGKAVPEKRPSDLALNVFLIRVVDRRLYLPTVASGATDTTIDGQTYVNTYTRASVPEIPANPTAQEIADLERVKAHCEWLIPDERERWLALSWMAHIVQTNGRSRWALVFLGVEGSGKTFFFEMLGLVLGRQNVRAVGPKEIEKEFNGWIEGVQLVVFEEIKQHGHNRYDVLNALKPVITNDYVSVRRMRTDSYMVPNTASIMAYTNFADALPINDRDRRYMLVATAPTKDDVAAKGADYFTDLFDAAERSAGMIRGWLAEMDLHPDFNPNGRAPMTAWKHRAVELTERDEVSLVRQVIEDTAGAVPGLSRTLLSTTVLSDHLAEKGEAVPMTKSLNRALMDIGLTFLGRVKAGGVVHRFWSDTPARWSQADGTPRTDAIRGWLDPDL